MAKKIEVDNGSHNFISPQKHFDILSAISSQKTMNGQASNHNPKLNLEIEMALDERVFGNRIQ